LLWSIDNSNYFRGTIVNDELTGVWREYDSLGTELNIIRMDSTGRKCRVESLIYEGSYFYGSFYGVKLIQNGEYYFLDKIKEKKIIGEFSYGKKSNYWIYLKKGKLSLIDFYNDSSLKSTFYNSKGDITHIIESNISDNKQNGLSVKMKDGVVLYRGKFKNGCKINKWVYFYNNGELKSEGTYLGDYIESKFINGSLLLFNKDEIMAREIYSPKVLEMFNVNEQVLYLKQGWWYYYNKCGLLIRKEYYVNGELIKNKKIRFKTKCE